MPDVRPEDFGAVPVGNAAPRPEDFGAVPMAAKGKPVDTDRQNAEDTPEWERRAAAVGRSMAAPFEGIKQGVQHAVGTDLDLVADLLEKTGQATPEQADKIRKGAASGIKNIDEEAQGKERAMQALYRVSPAAQKTGMAADAVGALLAPGFGVEAGAGKLARLAAGAKTGGAYAATTPVTSGGNYGTEKAKQVAEGGAWGAGLTGLADTLSKAPGAIKTMFTGRTKAPSSVPGSGAEKVTDELQGQRDLVEGDAKPGVSPGKQSDVEQIAARAQAATNKFKTVLQNTKDTVPVDNAMKKIDSMLSGKEVDPGVRAALKQAKATIEQALKNTRGPTTPTANGPMTIVNNKLVPAKNGVPLEVLDEVRQSISSQINQKGEKALSGHTKDLLNQINNEIVKASPKEYGNAVAGMAKAKAEMDAYAPKDSVLGKVTSDSKTFKQLEGMDSQRAIESAFSDKRSDRNIKDLGDLVKNNPEAQQGLRQAFREWFMTKSPTGEFKAGEFLGRWERARPVLDKTGLYPPDHIAALDKVVKDIARSQSTEGTRRAMGTAAGYVLGLPLFHPHIGAHLGSNALGGTSKAATNQLDNLLVRALNDPQMAALLAAPPTSGNVGKAMAIFGAREGSEQPAPRRRRSVMSMQPAGL